ncbi:hypothetical protein V1511DRAFT_505890 [Dipodascopsis uninucleata]
MSSDLLDEISKKYISERSNTDNINSLDSVDRKILNLRTKLAPSPHSSSQYREEYVTYLKPQSDISHEIFSRGEVESIFGKSSIYSGNISDMSYNDHYDSDLYTPKSDNHSSISAEFSGTRSSEKGQRGQKRLAGKSSIKAGGDGDDATKNRKLPSDNSKVSVNSNYTTTAITTQQKKAASTNHKLTGSLLPKMLSPTLPAIFDQMTDDDSAVESLSLSEPEIPYRMLSPTLPPIFDKESELTMIDDLNGHDNDDDGDLDKKRKIVVLRIPSWQKTGSQQREDSVKISEEGATRRQGETSRKSKPLSGTLVEDNSRSSLNSSGKKEVLASLTASSSNLHSPHKSKVQSSNISPARSDRQLYTPPPSQAEDPVTPISHSNNTTKKSTFAEYSKRRQSSIDNVASSPIEANESPRKHAPQLNSSRNTSRNATNSQLKATESSNNSSEVKLLEKKSQRWISVATNRKHESDRLKDASENYLAALYAADALIAYMVAFDYDDKCTNFRARLPSGKNWMTLAPYIRHLINIFESIKEPALAGLSYQIRAIIYLRIAGIQQQSLKSLQQGQQTSTGEFKQVSQDELMVKVTQNMDLALFDFQRGNRLLPIELIMERFSTTWKQRTSCIDGISAAAPVQLGGRHTGSGLRPFEDQYSLPIHMYSSIREVAAFSAILLKEWARKKNLKYESILSVKNSND